MWTSTRTATTQMVASANINAGTYTVSLAAGTYRVNIQPGSDDPALVSWHNAKASCESADVVTVAGSGQIGLVASGASRITGHPTSANGPVQYGTVGFYTTCEDYTTYEPAAETSINSGEYTLLIPNGTYRVLIQPSLSSNAVRSWHNAKATCDQATVVTVNGNATIDPVAATGTHLTGAVTSSNGAVSSGSVMFYSSCQAYEDWDASGHSSIRDGQYSAWLPPGSYRAVIQPTTDTAARSWHNAKNSCAGAEAITVAGSSMSQGLVASAGVDVTGLVTKGGKPIAYRERRLVRHVPGLPGRPAVGGGDDRGRPVHPDPGPRLLPGPDHLTAKLARSTRGTRPPGRAGPPRPCRSPARPRRICRHARHRRSAAA